MSILKFKNCVMLLREFIYGYELILQVFFEEKVYLQEWQCSQNLGLVLVYL